MTSFLVMAAVIGLCAGCVSTDHRAVQPQTAMPVFDPIAFFAGHTQGTGTLSTALHHSESTFVEGDGRIEPDGSIELEQTVRRGTDKPTQRRWHLRRVGTARYSGDLTDAVGPVTGDVEGNRLHLVFGMKGGLSAQQWLFLEPDGSVVQNVMIVRKFGIPVARLEETIRRTTPSTIDHSGH